MAEINNLTKEYLLKIAPDISVFEIFDMYDAKPNISFDKTYYEKGDSKKFKRALYRIEHNGDLIVSSSNSFLHTYDVDGFTYVIAVCEKDDEYVELNATNAIEICKVGF